MPIPINLSYPMEVTRSDKKLELIVQLNKQKEFYDWSLVLCRGISFMIHSPDYLARFADKVAFIFTAPNTIFHVKVTPEIVRTDPDLLKLPLSARECYKENEKSLKFFKIYTQRNCEIECITNYTYSQCGCVGLVHATMVEEGIDNCFDSDDYDCCNKAVAELVGGDTFSIERNCSCLPTCDSVSYNIEYLTEVDTENEEMATISVRMDMDEIVLYRRYQQFTFSDVVSYVGGLLGLFAGISMLSLVEIFYFFTIRLGMNFCRTSTL